MLSFIAAPAVVRKLNSAFIAYFYKLEIPRKRLPLRKNRFSRSLIRKKLQLIKIEMAFQNFYPFFPAWISLSLLCLQ